MRTIRTKPGCKIEEVKLRTAKRLVNRLAVFCIISWRVFWITIGNRTSPTAPPATALTALEAQIFDRLAPDMPSANASIRGLAFYTLKIVRLGGNLNRRSDLPPGGIVLAAATPNRSAAAQRDKPPSTSVITHDRRFSDIGLF